MAADTHNRGRELLTLVGFVLVTVGLYRLAGHTRKEAARRYHGLFPKNSDLPTSRHTITVSDAAWNEFNTMLDRPARTLPGLQALMNRRTPWDS